MKIGILSLNFSWHGEATAAATWTKYLVANGYDAELFTFSRSGKKLKRMRTDYDFTCLKSRDTDESLRFLDSKDVIVSFGTGVVGENEFEEPHYMEALRSMQTPLVAYIPIQSDLLFKAYKWSATFLTLPTVKASLFLRESIRSFCYEKGSEYFGSLPHEVVKHPVDMTGVKVRERLGKKFVSATRIAPSKKIKQLLTAIYDYDLRSVADISIWGDKGESRYGYLLEQEFGALFLDLYKGPYTHSQLDDVYREANFCFDLTNFASDGGVQNTYLEAMKRSVIPIVPEHWDVNESCLTIPEPDPAYISIVVGEALEMSSYDRLQKVERGHEYIRASHNPVEQTSRLVGYLEGIIGN